MLFKKHLFLLYLLFYSHIGLADEDVPDFFEVNYTLYSNDTKIGLMERRFFKDDAGNYIFRSESKTTGLVSIFRKDQIIEESNWHFINANFTPLHYIYQHTGGKRDRDVEINFDWDKKKIFNRVNDSIWHMETQPGILDKLLYQLVIMAKLKAGQIPEKFTIADGGKIKQYLFEFIDDEIIDTPIGQLKTMKLQRHKPNSDRKTLLWCAYELDFLPIKVINTEKKGRLTTAIIESLNGFGFETDS